MNRAALLLEDYFARIEQTQRLYHRKEYRAALQRAGVLLGTLRADDQLQVQDRTLLLLELLSLRGLYHTMLLQYQAAACDFDQCLKLDRYHVTTCFRRLNLLFKQKKLKQAFAEMKVAFRLSPETKYRGYELDLFQQLLEESHGEFALQIKKELADFVNEEEGEDEENEVAFMNLKSIDKCQSKSKRKMVDFGEDRQIEIRKEAAQKVAIPLPALDLPKLRSENQELREYIQQLEELGPLCPPSTFRFSTASRPKSILKSISRYGLPSGSILPAAECQLLRFPIQKIKDIDGRKIKSAKGTKLGGSAMVADKECKMQYSATQAPTRSMIKQNGSYCAKPLHTGDFLQVPVEDDKTMKGFARVRDIEGKKRLRAGEFKARETAFEEGSQPEHQYDASGSALRKSSLKDPAKSMLRKGGERPDPAARKSLVCFLE